LKKNLRSVEVAGEIVATGKLALTARTWVVAARENNWK
jgi:hypothetical protein